MCKLLCWNSAQSFQSVTIDEQIQGILPKQRRTVKSSRGWRQATRSSAAIEQPSTRRHGHEVPATPAERTSEPRTRPLTIGDIPAIIQQVTETIANQTGNGLPPAETCQKAAPHSTSLEEGRQPPPATTIATCQGEEATTQQSSVLTLGDILKVVDAVANRLASHRANSSSDQPGSYLLCIIKARVYKLLLAYDSPIRHGILYSR